MGFNIVIIYIFIILVGFIILRFLETDEDVELHMMYSVFWPYIVAVIIIAGPFYLIDILVKNIKRNKNNK